MAIYRFMGGYYYFLAGSGNFLVSVGCMKIVWANRFPLFSVFMLSESKQLPVVA